MRWLPAAKRRGHDTDHAMTIAQSYRHRRAWFAGGGFFARPRFSLDDRVVFAFFTGRSLLSEIFASRRCE